jgi:hypothetical protein
LPAQVREFIRLRRFNPAFTSRQDLRHVVVDHFNMTPLKKCAKHAHETKSLVPTEEESQPARAQYAGRAFLMIMSVVTTLVISCVLYYVCIMSEHASMLSQFVRDLGRAKVLGLIGLGVLAVVLKRIFVDYLAEIAVYTTADQRSEHFNSRIRILEECCRKVRWLLKNREYESVAIAGHSLGSVIGYDAINWLRCEAQVSGDSAARHLKALTELTTLIRRLPEDEQEKGQAVMSELATCIEKASAALPSLLTKDDFQRLKTFITFGSPLNKVLYFFRVKIKPHECIRAHIVRDLYGFRRKPTMLEADTSILDSHKDIKDEIYWLNISSIMDFISARLVFFHDVHEHRRIYLAPGFCHMSYWHDLTFYKEVLAALHGQCRWETNKERITLARDWLARSTWKPIFRHPQ